MLRSSVLRMMCDSRLRLVPAIEILSRSVNIVMNWMSTSFCNKSKRRDQKPLRIGVCRCSSRSLRVRQFS